MPPYRSGKWVHDRAHHMLSDMQDQYGSEKGKQIAYAVATQQAHKLGKTPKGYGTAEGKRDAKAKYTAPKSSYVKTPNPKEKRAGIEGGQMLDLSAMISQALKEGEELAKVASAKPPVAHEEDTTSVDHEEALKLAASIELIAGRLSEVIDDRSTVEKLAELEYLRAKLAEEGLPLAGVMGEGVAPGASGTAMLTDMERPTTGTQEYGKDGSKTNAPPPVTSNNESARPGDASTTMQTDAATPPGGGEDWTDSEKIGYAYQQAAMRFMQKRAGISRVDNFRNFAFNKLAEEAAVNPNAVDATEPALPAPAGERGIESNESPSSFTKADAKGPVKPEMKPYLNEPMMTSSTDGKLQENLDNASSAGVKISMAKAYLRKLAEEGCSCGGKGSCGSCKVKHAFNKVAGYAPPRAEDPKVPAGVTPEQYSELLASLEIEG